MCWPELENLVRVGGLKREPAREGELEGLVRSGTVRLADARNSKLSLESRFDLAYNAAHALALTALRRCGYRSDNRFLVFQTLPHTLGIGPSVWRVLAKCHETRNLAEYEGAIEIDERLVTDLLGAAKAVADELRKQLALPPPGGD